ncbi:hypothetical protein M6D93_15175 [Jatrophihabitans telluris]|uniref:Uncharacterized protein n=1 Tax=Jatrophihabitans telluris TaxID=2038343 RepID=A0ABY4QWK6_9ACTN|nr:protein DpdD [Jatrophihabitans telluris]UQX87632.1 hypothetical protein M6D93_15175 [Jatrophihabitans telluris]
MTRTSDEFISKFFGPPNSIWPNTDPNDQIVNTIGLFLAALSRRGECPLILPRRDLAALPAILYVVCWDSAHAGRVRPLLEAAVAHSWCSFDGRVTPLALSDPVERAILDLVGPATTFKLRPTQESAGPTFRALQRLVSSLAETSLRTPTAARPVGRMLREFDLALASGAVQTSLTLLKEIEGFGGISHENVAFLQIRRLAQLGHDQDLLTHGSLPTLVYTDPPRLVREAVLGAWARARVIPVLGADGLDAAIALIRDSDPDIAMLADSTLFGTKDAGVATVCALVALLRQDIAMAVAFKENSGVAPDVLALARALAAASSVVDAPQIFLPVVSNETRPAAPANEVIDQATAEDSVDESEDDLVGTLQESVDQAPHMDQVPQPVAQDSWLAWVEHLGTSGQVNIDAGTADQWAPASSIDDQLAAAVDGLSELAVDDLLAGVTWFLETDDPENPASATAMALIRRYLLSERFAPSDLGALCSLIQIFLRGGPGRDTYRELLDDLRSYAPQWVAVTTATRVLDIADAFVCGPAVDAAGRSGFVTTLLAPLNAQKRRLPVSLRNLAGLICHDVELDLDWTVQEVEPDADAAAEHVSSLDPQILLYSLDIGTLARVQSAIKTQWPGARVALSAVKVGNQSLKGQSRGADIIVIATRRAAHAATGFISDNARADARIVYPDGSGSGSMLRVVESAIAEWAT